MGLRGAIERRLTGETAHRDPWDALFLPLSWLYGLGVRLGEWSLERGVRTVGRLPRPVISVGNITVGGTGKTPLVILLAEMLRDAGHRVAILSRGYARRGGPSCRMISDGKRIISRPEQAGDEPFMMARRLPGVSVWVGPHRHQVGSTAWARSRPTLFILDDGFQHRCLHRDLDVVVLRVPRPWGNGRLLPAGPLRERPGALARAHLLVLNQGGGLPDEEALREIRATASPAPVVRSRYRATRLWRIQDGGAQPLEALQGKIVALVCGIGHPRGFQEVVEGLGARVLRSLFFPDHYWYTFKDIEGLKGILPEVDALVTTEKDAWKLRAAGALHDRILALGVDLQIQDADLLRNQLARFL
jgi:tetraacyldisaccharide 4'-kinase